VGKKDRSPENPGDRPHVQSDKLIRKRKIGNIYIESVKPSKLAGDIANIQYN
jgi:hypothetical protein